MPSSVPLGGMRMSVSTASGANCADGGQQFVEVGGGADELDLGRLGQERHCSLADQVVILREHDAQHGRMVHGRLTAA